jgi:soluble lytic murein transglycosylase-like protein
MPPSQYDEPIFEDQAAASSRGGCLSGFMLPPLAVVCIGAVLAFFLLTGAPGITPMVMAAAPVQTQPAANLAAPAASMPTAQVSSSASGGSLSPVFRPEIQYWSRAIIAWAAQAGLDPNLVATVMQIESCGDPQATSRAGAMGLFQVMPYHFVKGEFPYNPDTNALRGLDYLKRSLAAANGNARLALAGYNGGIGVIDRSESRWAKQTQRYAYWGSGIYADASNGSTVSERLEEWYTIGGRSLCRQAAERLGINP